MTTNPISTKDRAVTLPFTANVCAHAVIAAASALGDDPVRAMTALRGVPRRSLAAAAWAVHRATVTPVDNVARSFGINADSLRAAASGSGPTFSVAFEAARARLIALGSLSPIVRAPAPPPPAPVAREPVHSSPSTEPTAPQHRGEQVTANERALIDAALAAGRVTKVPDGLAAGLSAMEQQFYAAPPPMGEGGWRVAHEQRKKADAARRKRGEYRNDEAA